MLNFYFIFIFMYDADILHSGSLESLLPTNDWI